jgi:hypothetical protein
LSVIDDEICPTIHKQNNPKPGFRVEGNTVECFETIHGAPVIGTLWHAEANDDNTKCEHRFNRALVRFMALAGRQYALKRQVLPCIGNFNRALNKTQTRETNQVVVIEEGALQPNN